MSWVFVLFPDHHFRRWPSFSGKDQMVNILGVGSPDRDEGKERVGESGSEPRADAGRTSPESPSFPTSSMLGRSVGDTRRRLQRARLVFA